MPATTIHTLPKRSVAVSSLKWQPLDIAVGATLDVGANQAPGHYSGTWTITLNYQ